MMRERHFMWAPKYRYHVPGKGYAMTQGNFCGAVQWKTKAMSRCSGRYRPASRNEAGVMSLFLFVRNKLLRPIFIDLGLE